ncbi:YheC/YheD family protein [Paenibacillus sp. YIM B09110]|uniref:YheC/YheD family protein n=1 Tax=Paenibacillus sp. YIM B09110 TaxID=3126102 RepID=UPI00301C8E4C
MDVYVNKAATVRKAGSMEDGPKAEVSINSYSKYRRLHSGPKKKLKAAKRKRGLSTGRLKSSHKSSKYAQPARSRYAAPPKRKVLKPAVKVRSSKDKWVKTKVLLRNGELRNHIPATKLFGKQSLYGMLRKFGMVYVKPTGGQMGIGVMRVEAYRGKFTYQHGFRKASFGSYEALYHALVRETRGKTYIVQKGINLLKHKGRPFDIRLMVQKSPFGGWEATGTLGRVAHPRKIVTNGSQGGSIYPTARLLKKYSDAGYRNRLIRHMDYIGLVTAKQMRAAYPGLRVIGLDLALDKHMKPWILEVNTAPDPCPFTLLPDKAMLRRIIRYARAYGRTYALNCGKARRGV